MMTDREKLIELLNTHCDYAGHVDCKEDCTGCLADHLLANGVTFAKSTNVFSNADRIRAMGDEELATLVRGVIFSKECPSVDSDCEKCFFREPCFGDFELLGKEVEWLKQPAEEGE